MIIGSAPRPSRRDAPPHESHLEEALGDLHRRIEAAIEQCLEPGLVMNDIHGLVWAALRVEATFFLHHKQDQEATVELKAGADDLSDFGFRG